MWVDSSPPRRARWRWRRPDPIRSMEESLGAALLVRSRQGGPDSRPHLAKRARILLATAPACARAQGLCRRASGQLLANTNALTEFLPEALSAFLAEHPHVSVDLEERLSDEIVGLVAEGVADIGIVAGTVDVGALATYPFRSDRFVVVTAKDHPLARETQVSAQVLDYDLVGLSAPPPAALPHRKPPARASRRSSASSSAPRRGLPAGGGGRGRGRGPRTTARRAEKTMSLAVIDLTDDWALRELTTSCAPARRALRMRGTWSRACGPGGLPASRPGASPAGAPRCSNSNDPSPTG
jgi:DNA-binding transcriptional LysR family regulator